MWKYHEVRENEGLVNQSASANKMGWAAKERWHDAEDADIKCLRDVGSEAWGAEPTAHRGNSKLETRRVRNNLIQWRDRPTVSALILLILYTLYEQCIPSPFLTFTQLLLHFYCARIVSIIFYTSIVSHSLQTLFIHIPSI